MFDSELVKSSSLRDVDDALKQIATTLRDMTATSMCNGAVTKAVASACGMLMSFCGCWWTVANPIDLWASHNITSLANIMHSLELLTKTLKTAGENAQVTFAEV